MKWQVLIWSNLKKKHKLCGGGGGEEEKGKTSLIGRTYLLSKHAKGQRSDPVEVHPTPKEGEHYFSKFAP